MAYTLTYELTNNRTEYAVSGYTGDPVDVEIPNEYMGLPVTSIGRYAFRNCSSLTRVVIGNGVTSIGEGAFDACTSLTSITVSTGNANYKSMDGNLYTKDVKTLLCYAAGNPATSFTIPNSVISIDEGAFKGCKKLVSVVIPDSVTWIGDDAFRNCSILTSITVSKGNANYKSIDGNLYTKDGKTLVQYAIGKTENPFAIPDSVTSIGKYAFYGCYRLMSIIIPDSVTSIGVRAFQSCKKLVSIEIPDSVTHIMEYAFYNCGSLTSVVIGKGVTSIADGAFSSCDSLTSITVDKHNMEYQSIDGALYTYTEEHGPELVQYAAGNPATSFTVPDHVTVISGCSFEGCKKLVSVVIPDSVKWIGDDAFRNCSSLTIYCEAEKPGWSSSWNYSNCPVVWNCNNNDLASDGCIYVVVDNIRYGIKGGVATVVRQARNIQTANISANITHKGTAYNVTSIGSPAFRDCTSLTSVVIPDSVTTIGERAFYYCTSLTSVVIPDSVTFIGNSAFFDCDSLTSIAILAKTPPSIGSHIFSNISETAKFYCYSSALQSYKTATNWNVYADSFIADEMRLYFAMSAQAQKKYFVSKAEFHQYVQQYLHDNFAVLIAEYLTKN